MAYDGRLLAAAREELEKIKERNSDIHEAREREVYSRLPEIRSLESRMRERMTAIVRLTISKPDDLREQLDAVKTENLALQAKRTALLKQAGFPEDYLEPIVSCPLCNDTGVRNGSICSCLKKLYNAEVTRSLSPLMVNGDECFENFKLSYYPAEFDRSLGATPAEYMAAVLKRCKIFADSFPEGSKSLLFQGGTGLGKTYLSACIARVVAEKGYSVCYDTAISVFDAFDRQRFSRSQEDSDEADRKINFILNADLLILDDLGTELVTAVSSSALYSIVNSRLVSGKQTIISTNCTDAELERKYSPQTFSRLIGEYIKLPFAGTDIRKLKKGL